MMFEPRESFHNLLRIQYDLRAYGRGGFFDAASVKGGTRSLVATCRSTRP